MADISSSLPVKTLAAGDLSVKTDQTTHGTTDLVAADVTKVAGTAAATGNGVTGAGSPRVTVASDNTPFATKTDQTTHGTTDLVAADITKLNGVAALAGNGVTGTGSPRVTVASDNTPFAVKTDQTTHGTTDKVAADLTLIAGTATAVGNGVVGNGVQRVAIASDNTAIPVSFGDKTNAASANTYGTKAALGAAASTTTEIQYTVAGSGTAQKFAIKGFMAAGSGKIKVRLLGGTTAGIATADKATAFNSSANPTINFALPQQIEVPTTSTGIVRLEITNLESVAQDVYGTIFGAEV